MKTIRKIKMKNSKIVILIVALFCSTTGKSVVVPKPPKVASGKVLVGAIRWDAWIGNIKNGISIGLQVERSLSPGKFHYRAPFFSKVIGPDSIQCREVTQPVMDQDISYANYAGIDYWAFLYYKSGTGMEIPRNLYLNSTAKNGLKWCLILQNAMEDDEISWLINQFKRPDYQKVLNGRPLLYLYQMGNRFTPDQLNNIRQLSIQAGLKDPYVVLMNTKERIPALYNESFGINAFSRYNSYAGSNGSAYFPSIPNADSNGWKSMQLLNKQVVPWVTTGRNMKPRIERQVSWQKISSATWVADGTPQQIASNVKNAVNWVKANPGSCEANTIIIYAWNEFDEGGWLCPTFGNDISRIKAVKEALRLSN
jgi:hypothetical protein